LQPWMTTRSIKASSSVMTLRSRPHEPDGEQDDDGEEPDEDSESNEDEIPLYDNDDDDDDDSDGDALRDEILLLGTASHDKE